VYLKKFGNEFFMFDRHDLQLKEIFRSQTIESFISFVSSATINIDCFNKKSRVSHPHDHDPLFKQT